MCEPAASCLVPARPPTSNARRQTGKSALHAPRPHGRRSRGRLVPSRPHIAGGILPPVVAWIRLGSLLLLRDWIGILTGAPPTSSVPQLAVARSLRPVLLRLFLCFQQPIGVGLLLGLGSCGGRYPRWLVGGSGCSVAHRFLQRGTAHIGIRRGLESHGGAAFVDLAFDLGLEAAKTFQSLFADRLGLAGPQSPYGAPGRSEHLGI